MEQLYPDLSYLVYETILKENGFLELIKFYEAVKRPEKDKIWLFIQSYDIRKLYIMIYMECILDMADLLNFNMLQQFKNELQLDFSPYYEYEIMNRVLKESEQDELVPGSKTHQKIIEEIKKYERQIIRKAFENISFKNFKKFTSIHFPDFIDPWVRQDDPAVKEFQICLRKKFRYLKTKFDIDVLSDRNLR
jgi:hypothetical protein